MFIERSCTVSQDIIHVTSITSIKILGVTITNGLSASDHVRDVITSCAQTLYALRVLRAHGMCQEALQTIFRSVTIAKLFYASNAWSGFTKATDKQRVNGFLRRSIRCGYCSPDFPTFADQCATADEKTLIKSVLTITTYCTVSFLLLHLFHRATTFDLVRTVWNYRNILAIWLSLHECFLLTFTKFLNYLLMMIFFPVSVYLKLHFISLSNKWIWMNDLILPRLPKGCQLPWFRFAVSYWVVWYGIVGFNVPIDTL